MAVNFTFYASATPYTPPKGDAVHFSFLKGDPDYALRAPAIRSSVALRHEKAKTVDRQFKMSWDSITNIELQVAVTFDKSTPVNVGTTIKTLSKLTTIDKVYTLGFNRNDYIDSGCKIPYQPIMLKLDVRYDLKWDSFDTIESKSTFEWAIPATKDSQTLLTYSKVNLLGGDRIKHVRYYHIPPQKGNVTFDFSKAPVHNLNANKTPLIFDFSVRQPLAEDLDRIPKVKYDAVKAVQPTDAPVLHRWSKSKVNDTQTLIRYNALKDLIVGSGTKLKTGKDDDVNPEPPTPDKTTIVHIPYEVYQIMNTINIKDVLTNTIIDFVDFTMQRDIDSFVWTLKFTLNDPATLGLIKPVGRELKSVIVNINGVDIRGFIGKVTKSTSVNKQSGKVTTTWVCSAWSELRKLGDPYARKQSNTVNVSTASNLLVTGELTGTGHTVEWLTTTWNVVAGIHSYQNKTPIGAILSVVNSIGGVIVPHLSENSFKVLPRFPVSPWNWYEAATIPDRSMSESQFFSVDNESIPVTNPDSIYVYGNDVGAHAIRFGKNGSKPLPDVVNKYLSTVVACQERARVEVAKGSYLENIPMSTYVDNKGLIMPQELLEITDLDGTVWRGQVSSTAITCKRIGSAILQSINVQRFHNE